jgi:acetylornithine/N-succinyldiaminopimelate aminotransferase
MPDVMTLAKGLGSGVPIGACVAKGIAAETFTPGKHGSTFGGNPLATAAGMATLNIIAEEKLRENAETIGDWLNAEFTAAFKGNKSVVNIRNAGLMVGIELNIPCADLVKQALEHKLLINVTADKVIRLLPPLIMNQQEAQILVDKLVPLVNAFIESKA